MPGARRRPFPTPFAAMPHSSILRLIPALALAAGLCSGCAVVAVADAVVTTGAVIVKTGVQATGAVVGAVLP